MAQKPTSRDVLIDALRIIDHAIEPTLANDILRAMTGRQFGPAGIKEMVARERVGWLRDRRESLCPLLEAQKLTAYYHVALSTWPVERRLYTGYGVAGIRLVAEGMIRLAETYPQHEGLRKLARDMVQASTRQKIAWGSFDPEAWRASLVECDSWAGARKNDDAVRAEALARLAATNGDEENLIFGANDSFDETDEFDHGSDHTMSS
jgi:hypothetical protein